MADILDLIQPVEQTAAQKSVAYIVGVSATLLEQAVQAYNLTMATFWTNKEHAAAVCSELGARAVSAFVRSASLRDFILAQRPDWVDRLLKVPEGISIAFNEDGTVTIA